MRTIQRTIVGSLLVAKDGKIFLGKRSNSGVWPGTWHIPGGGVDPGETAEEALSREVAEELDLDISSYPKVLVSDSDTGEAEKILKTGETVLAQMRFFVYRVEVSDKASWEISLKVCDEFSEFAWVLPEEIKNYRLPPPSVRLFKKLGLL